MSAEHNVAVVRCAVEEIWNRGDLHVADELFEPGYVNHGGLIPDLVCGPEAIKISVALYRIAFPTLHITVDSLLGKEDTVVLGWIARGTLPELPGNTSTGQRGGVAGRTRTRLAGGKIVESWTRWDRAGVLRQLSLLSRRGPEIWP